MKRRFLNWLYKCFNLYLPKNHQVIVLGNTKMESNAVEMANYIHANYDIPVYYLVTRTFMESGKKILSPGIKLVEYGPRFRFILSTSKYVFSTHPSSKGIFTGSLARKQVLVNVWHGVFYKNIRKLRGESGIPADVTVGTSILTKKMFSEAFGVEPESVFISGYPRNDIMLRAHAESSVLKSRVKPDLNSYSKVLLWMPTFRRAESGDILKQGLEPNNPFQVEGFDDDSFNELLKSQNALCLIKPHYFGADDIAFKKYSNILVIDDDWIVQQGITLYHLLACMDALVTDYSSVIIDFLLLDKPVLCFSTDYENYKNTQGLYFENFEDWIPTEFHRSQEDFFKAVEGILLTGEDGYEEKRQKLRDIFFTYKDAHSAERLCTQVFKDQVKKRPTLNTSVEPQSNCLLEVQQH